MSHRIVILGAGFAGIYAYRHLHRLLHGRRDVHLTLVNSSNYFLFTPLLHEVATGGVAPENIIEPLRDVIGCCVDEFIRTDAEKIFFRRKQVMTGAGILGYDSLVLAIGAETNFMDVPGAKMYCLQLKSLSNAVRLKNHVIDTVEAASRQASAKQRKRLLTFVVIGGGPTGVEFACELSDFVRKTLSRYYVGDAIAKHCRIILLQAAAELVPQFPFSVRRASHAACTAKGVDVRTNVTAKRVEKECVILSNGDTIETSCAVWVAGVKARSLACDDEKTKHANGAFLVSPTLQLERYADVFAFGDCAIISSSPVPQAAQAAVQQARVAASNLVRRIDGLPLISFAYKNRGTLLSLGDYHAAGQIGPVAFSGVFCWWVWRTVYLLKMPTFRKKAKLVLDWTLDLFLPRDVSKIE